MPRWFAEFISLRRAIIVCPPADTLAMMLSWGKRDVSAWCRENLIGRYGVQHEVDESSIPVMIRATIWFIEPRDAVAFKLRWF